MPLECPTDVAEWEAAHRVKLYPGKVNRWLMVVRAPDTATLEDLSAQVTRAFQAWLDKFEGRISPPVVSVASEFVSPPFEVRAPSQFVEVAFTYFGKLEDMPLPTYTARRRERLNETCPYPPVDTTVVKVLGWEDASGSESDSELLEPRNVKVKPDIDLGIGPLPNPGALVTIAAVIGIGLGVLVVLKDQK